MSGSAWLLADVGGTIRFSRSIALRADPRLDAGHPRRSRLSRVLGETPAGDLPALL